VEDTVVGLFELLSLNLSSGTEKKHKKRSQEGSYPGRDLKRASLQHVIPLPLGAICSVEFSKVL
jgi:hypothetical protein